MKKIGLFYSFNTRNTARVAEKIKEVFGAEAQVDMINVEEITEDEFLSYQSMILGVPTWFDGELPNYWDEFMPAVEEMKLKDYRIAIFGLGDQKGYPQNFADAIGIIAEALESRGATIVGETENVNYEFEKSFALRNGKFVGLVLDEDNQPELTDERVNNWVKELQKSL